MNSWKAAYENGGHLGRIVWLLMLIISFSFLLFLILIEINIFIYILKGY